MTTATTANPRYIDLARAAQRRGLYPTPPIDPKEKGPRYLSWPQHSVYATTRPELGFLERWAEERPTWNCGVVAQPETPYFNLDSDDLEALHAEWAQFSSGKPFPETLFVYSRTDEQGHRRGHYHFLKTSYSNVKLGHVSNWGLASETDPTNQFAELQYTSGQCVWAGSIHSKTGQPLTIEVDMPMQPVPDLFVDFLAALPRSTRQGRGKAGGGFVALTDGELEGMTANSGRHDYLNSCAGFYTNGDEDELLETLSEINSKFGEPCEDDYVARLAADFAQLEPAAKAVTTYCHSVPGHMWLFTDRAAYEKCKQENPAPATETPKPQTVTRPKLRLVNFSKIQTKPINWLWPGKMAIGHITTMNGDPGTKKSFISLDIAARISTGRAMPDGTPNPFPPSSVLVLTREDGLEDTVKPRFLAAGGNPTKLDSVAIGDSQETAVFKLEESLHELEEIMQPDTRVIIFDPLIDFIKAQQNHEAEVRDVLTKLKQFAERRELSIIGINHLNKKSDLDAIHRTMGAKGFIGVARMNFLVGKDEGGNLHLCSLKNNLWADDGSLTFKLEDSVVTDGHIILNKVGRVVWTGKGQLTADELSAPKGKTAQNRAQDWLKGYMLPVGEKKPAKDIYEAGMREGFSEDQLKRTLQKIAKHERTKEVPSTTVWWLPISECGW
jgi:putative DNA primase/helicase